MSISNFYSVETVVKKAWPKNLSVRKLKISGPLSLQDIENLGSIACKLDLTFDSVMAEQIYQLLDLKGLLVKTLTIDDRHFEVLQNTDGSEDIPSIWKEFSLLVQILKNLSSFLPGEL